tara:strand:+ start:149 stop:859 length:711 start_codon:yes stop_codon:yes gene_type:complete
MIKINDKTLLERQINTINKVGINNISIVTGYKAEAINYPNIKYYHNKLFNSTNMIESLMCASDEFNQDLIITYGDLIYTEHALRKLMVAKSEVCVCIDSEWKNYWMYRYGEIDTDLETLTINNNTIVELGSTVSSSKNIFNRYVGIIKISKKIIPEILSIYKAKRKTNNKWEKSLQPFLKGYMTDLLNEMIVNNISLDPIEINKNWLEIDTSTDYDNLVRDYNNGNLNKYYLGDLN